MNYQETLNYLYENFPIFQKEGKNALFAGLKNIELFCGYLDNPHQKFPSIHIAGTNGKGSSAHFIAAVLQAAGYKTGLHTSPHLKEFGERIRIDGQQINPDFIVDFVQKYRSLIEDIRPSFFELTVIMTFDYFAQENVDIAVIEVGLGGRLDSTNIIEPEACLITNISYDHESILGNTLEKIASEKAGIIKKHTPVIITEKQVKINTVFEQKAQNCEAPIFFAEDEFEAEKTDSGNLTIYKNQSVFLEKLTLGLKGDWQIKNALGIITLCDKLKKFQIAPEHLRQGLSNVTQLTGLRGRWQILQEKPKIICDTGHNEAGVKVIVEELKKLIFRKLHIVWGCVNDKDIRKILPLLPQYAYYYFCEPNIARKLAVTTLSEVATEFGLEGEIIPNVTEALQKAKQEAQEDDLIFIGGSTFVVSELELN